LPHLAFPVVTDPKKVLLALRWLIDEMERRYKISPAWAFATSSASMRGQRKSRMSMFECRRVGKRRRN